MNVLIVDEEIPWPLNTGKRIRTYNLVQRLQRDHTVTYLCYGEPGTLLPDCPNVTLIVLPSPVLEQKGARFYLALLANLFSHKPYIVARHYSKVFEDNALTLVSANNFDLVHCEWTPYTENIRLLIGKIPTVLSAHNVEAQIWERYYQAEINPFKKKYIFHQWQKLVRYESETAKKYTIVATVSEPDRYVFAKHYGCRQVTVVPNGVDEQYFSPVETEIRPNSMVFTGSMDWRPNQDGVRYFIEVIFPLIKRDIPAATFTVVGRKPPQWLMDLAGKVAGVTVTGTVDDVRPYIAESSLYVVPLRVGGGSRLKILEALSMQKTVLSTSVGAEGLNLLDGNHLVLRDSEDTFAAKAVEILTSQHRFKHLGMSGRELIIREYTWDAISRAMELVWQQASAAQ